MPVDRKLTSKQTDEIKSLFKRGKTASEISKLYPWVTASYIARLAKPRVESNLQAQKQLEERQRLQSIDALALLSQGVTIQRTACLAGSTVWHLKKWLNEQKA